MGLKDRLFEFGVPEADTCLDFGASRECGDSYDFLGEVRVTSFL